MTRYPLYRRLGGHQGWCCWVWKILPPLGFNPWTVQPKQVTLPTTLSWLMRKLCCYLCHSQVEIYFWPLFWHIFIVLKIICVCWEGGITFPVQSSDVFKLFCFWLWLVTWLVCFVHVIGEICTVCIFALVPSRLSADSCFVICLSSLWSWFSSHRCDSHYEVRQEPCVFTPTEAA
jgi:hypothetical protein